MRHAFAPALLLSLVHAACASRQPAPTPGSGQTQNTTRVVMSDGRNLTIPTVTNTTGSAATVEAPVERAWQLLPAVYQELGIDYTSIDQTRFTIGNPGLRVRGKLGRESLTRYVDCGSGQLGAYAASYDVTLSLVTQLTPAPDNKTAITSVLQAKAKSPIHSTGDIACASTHRLENRIATLLRVKLQ